MDDLGFSVMDRCGIDPNYAAKQEGWTSVNCASKRAYGCGEMGNSAVQDLHLLVHHDRGDLQSHLSSSLSVRAGDEVFRWIQQEIAAKGARQPKDRYLRSKVEAVDKGLIVVTLCFSDYGGFYYYLVFDSVDRSLSLIPYIPDWATSYTKSPLSLRHDDGGYSLVLVGEEFGFRQEGAKKYLWQWSRSWGDAWQTRKLRFPSQMKNEWFFSPDVIFSSNGFAFWTDLALGTLCCDCTTLLSDGYLVKFTFIGLPPGCQQLDRLEDTWPVQLYRTMGYVGGSIKFVALDKPQPCHGGGGRSGTRSLKVWTLAPSGRQWNLYSDFPLKKLWKDFKRDGLPKNLPMWPMLREQQGAATLYFILAEDTQTRDQGHKHHIGQLDMPTKTLLQSKLLAHTSLIHGPVILPSGFFKYLGPLPSGRSPSS